MIYRWLHVWIASAHVLTTIVSLQFVAHFLCWDWKVPTFPFFFTESSCISIYRTIFFFAVHIFFFRRKFIGPAMCTFQFVDKYIVELWLFIYAWTWCHYLRIIYIWSTLNHNHLNFWSYIRWIYKCNPATAFCIYEIGPL